jgi:hypothetical protein
MTVAKRGLEETRIPQSREERESYSKRFNDIKGWDERKAEVLERLRKIKGHSK